MALGLSDVGKRKPTAARTTASGKPVEKKSLSEVLLPHSTGGDQSQFSAPETLITAQQENYRQITPTCINDEKLNEPPAYDPESPVERNIPTPSSNMDNFKADDLNARSKPDNNPIKEETEPDKKHDKEKTKTRLQPDNRIYDLSGCNANSVDLRTKPDNNPIKEETEPDKKHDKEKTETRLQPDNGIYDLSGCIANSVNLKTKPDNNPIITQQETRQKSRQQPDKKSVPFDPLEDVILSLPQNPMKAFSYICESLINSGGEHLRTSYKLLSLDTGIPEGSIRSVLKNQLRNTFGLIDLQADGGGPQAKIRIFVGSDTLRIFIKVRHNNTTTRQQPDKKLDKEPDNLASSKLVNINNNILTKNSDIYDGYEEIDVALLKPLGVFLKQVLDVRNQLRKDSIVFTASQMQSVVDRFVKYCSKSSNIGNIRNLQAFFCSSAVAIAKGESDPFGEVLSSGDEALLIVNKRRQEEMALKLRIDDMLAKTEFEHWKFDLSGEERKKILGNLDAMNLNVETLDSQLYHHFYNFVWPDLRLNFKNQIADEMKTMQEGQRSVAQAAIFEKAKAYLRDSKWVAQTALSHDLLRVQSPEARQKKIEEIAMNLASSKGI